jgi:hypothetical protein
MIPSLTPYWMSHLCKLAEAVDAAETRRAAAQTALLQAEADLDAAFMALTNYYARLPYQIKLNRESLEKIDRLLAAWFRRSERHPSARALTP